LGLLFLSALVLAFFVAVLVLMATKPQKVKFSSMVGFGDSLSDAGSDKVGLIANLGGGMYNVNPDSSKNWTTWLSAQLGFAL